MTRSPTETTNEGGSSLVTETSNVRPAEAGGAREAGAPSAMAPPTVASATPAAPGSGATLAGKYLLGAPLGQGGMGVVYEAVQLTLGRTVAVKLLPASADPTSTARFAREARALAQLAHPGIVQIFDFATDAGVTYVVMERLYGRDLANALRAEPRFDIGRSVQIASEVLQALSVAHAHGIIHRDIKPANVFLEAGMSERVRLLDFGIASTNDGSPRLTETGVVVGTPAYMALEQLLGRAADPRTDLRAVGACLFQMLTGQRPFAGATGAALVEQIVRGDPPRADSLRAEVPTRLADVVARAMAREPADRFADAVTMLAALEPWRTGVGLAAPTSPAPAGAAATLGMPPALVTEPLRGGVHTTAEMLPRLSQTQPNVHVASPPNRPAASSSRFWLFVLGSLLVTIVAGLAVGVFALATLRPGQAPVVSGDAAAPRSATSPSAPVTAAATAVSAAPVTAPNTGAISAKPAAPAASAKDTRVPSVCFSTFELCPEKITTCDCSGDALLFPRPQTQDNFDSSVFSAPGKVTGEPCTGFTKAITAGGTFESQPGSGKLRCSDCSRVKALSRPVLAIPGTPCSGVANGSGQVAGTWRALKP